MVYALMIEQRERVALALIARGGDPNILIEDRDAFDLALAEAPPVATVTDIETRQIDEALGRRRVG